MNILGEIKANGDLATHTHTFTTQEAEIFGLKSNIINLNAYKGKINIEGEVTKIHGDLPIVTVKNIGTTKIEIEPVVEDIDEEKVKESSYIMEADLFFPKSFFEKYNLENDGSNSTIAIVDMADNETIEIIYFNCKNNQDRDCVNLTNDFKNSAPQNFTTAEGTTFYKHHETQARFGNNKDEKGYIINNTSDDKVKKLISNLRTINKSRIEKNIIAQIRTICENQDITIKSVEKTEIKQLSAGRMVEIQAKTYTDNVQCKIKVDPSEENSAIVLSLTKQEAEAEEELEELEETEPEDTDDDIETDNDRDTDVEQFPINLEKTKEFTSRRGHKIVFPSGNLSYQEFKES
jgi:hypothetical protein